MHQLNYNKINLLIDFDSTFIKEESLELISIESLNNSDNKEVKINLISEITSKAMNGDIPFSEALIQRIKLLNANKDNLSKTIKIIQDRISTSFIKNMEYFIYNSNNCYIVSGGFKEIIYPIVKQYGFKSENIFANEFIYDKNENIISIDKKNPLSKNYGKVEVAKKIKGENIIIGDGYTDYEIKKFGEASTFIQFIENINRKNLNSKADFIACNFNEIINYIDKKYFK